MLNVAVCTVNGQRETSSSVAVCYGYLQGSSWGICRTHG